MASQFAHHNLSILVVIKRDIIGKTIYA